jgi:pantothenate kinase-related protein Tda10
LTQNSLYVVLFKGWLFKGKSLSPQLKNINIKTSKAKKVLCTITGVNLQIRQYQTSFLRPKKQVVNGIKCVKKDVNLKINIGKKHC